MNYGSANHVHMVLMQLTSFYFSKMAENMTWYCKPCKLLAMNAVLEDKSIKDKCKVYTNELNLKLKILISYHPEKSSCYWTTKTLEESKRKLK